MTESNFSKKSAVAQEHDFEQQAVSIGSHEENDIVLAGPGVLPFHATAVLDGEYCRLISMEPAAMILFDGVTVGETPVSVEGFQQVEIGNHVLFFQRNGAALRILTRPIDEKAAAQYAANEGESTILLNVFTGEAEVDVEQMAVYEFEVVNAGPIVASFYVTVKGCPAEWVEISPDTINLNEGQRRNVEIQITPPRDPSSHAGTHPIEVIVHSPNYGGQRGLAELSLIIHPYYEYALGNLSPKNQRIRWRKKTGMTYLPITNMSNGPADFSLMAMDDENGCTFDFCIDEEVQLTRQATTKLTAGETAEVPIEITPTKNPMFAFRNKRYHYTTNVSIPQNPGAPQVLSGSATSVPLFGWWSIVLTIAAFVIAAFFVLQPNIRSFDVAAGKDVIELGDTTKLLWDVSPFATRLSISNVDDPITRGQFSRTVAPEQSTTYELISGNWLSGMFGLDQKQIVTVLVVPPTPQVNVFDVDETTIAKGKPINVRWSVKEADEAFLTIDEVVYPLTPEEFSGEQEVILEKDALVTLEARNASGSELQSYFVNVVPPYIDITTFTVWVRPDEGTTAPADDTTASVDGAGKALMSKTTAPDPSFPVKFVELVADPNSETGYRVVFNPNVREELQKGEQVVLEWNVAGVESLEIAPFADALPAHGSQPAFPQESMNFVMTAQSGELQGIYMLPIKVFDGEPPEAPKIEFFTASPSTLTGPGDSEFAWSVSGEWSRVQLSSGEDIIADYLNPQGFQTVSIDETKNILLTAWNGDLSSSDIIEVVVNPALLPVNVEITDVRDHSGFFYVGDTVNVFVDITDPELPDPNNPGKFLPPSPYPIGTITVSDGYQTCVIELPLKSCPDGFTFNAPGDPENGNKKSIVARYSGDDIYQSKDSDPYSKQDIIVQANTVKLAPSFFEYYVGTGNTSVTSTAEVRPLKNADLKVGEGLFIEVTVTATRGPLDVNDDKGQVVARYCPIDELTREVQLDECIRTAPATVNVTGDPNLGINLGHAEIFIPNLQAAGDYQMLISYSHLDGAYEATLLEDEDNQFTVKQGTLVLVPDGLLTCSSSYCEIAGRTDDSLNFKAYLVVNNTEIPLHATYPQPEDRLADAFVVDYIHGGSTDHWADDECLWAATDKWRLECENITITVDGTISYEFEDDNYKGDKDITVSVKKVTEIITDDAFAGDLFIGETIDLQGGNVFVRELESPDDPNTADVYPPADGIDTYPYVYMEVENVDDISTILGIVPDGDGDLNNDCSVVGGKLQMPQSTSPISDSCKVFFKHAGIYDARFIYNGNATHEKSDESYEFAVGQQQVEIEWESAAGTALPDDSQWEIYEFILVHLSFGCNNVGANCTDFEASSLSDASLEFEFNSTQECSVYYPDENTELTTGEMNLPTVAVGGDMEIDIKLRCKKLGAMEIDIQYVDPSNTDFITFADKGGKKGFEIIQKDVAIDPKFYIYTDTGQTLLGDITNPIGDNIQDPPVMNDDDKHLWIGEKYLIYTEFAIPADAHPTSDDVIIMRWPSGLDSRVDFVDCVDGYTGQQSGRYHLPLTKDNPTDTSWKAICSFKPNQTLDFDVTGKKIEFSLATAGDPQLETSSSEEIELHVASGNPETPEASIKKRPVDIAIDAGMVTDYYAHTGPKLIFTIDDDHYLVDAITDWDQYVTVTWNSASLTCTNTASTIECDIPDTQAVNSTYSIRYRNHSVFADTTVSNSLNIVAVPVKLTNITQTGETTTRLFPERISCKWLNCAGGTYGWPNAGRNAAFTGYEYALEFSVDVEPAEVAHKVEGFVTVDFGNWSDCDVTILRNSASPIQGEKCAFRVEITGADGNEKAKIEWKFTGVVDDLDYTFGYYNGGTHPFTKGSDGWVPSTLPMSDSNYYVYEWLDFKVVEKYNAGAAKYGFEITKPDGTDLPLQEDGYTVRAEYPSYGGSPGGIPAGFSEMQLICEDSPNACWGSGAGTIYDKDDDEDGWVDTSPNWKQVVDKGCEYQVIVTEGTKNIVGWVTNP